MSTENNTIEEMAKVALEAFKALINHTHYRSNKMKPQTIAEQWNIFKESCIPNNAPKEQFEEMEKAFYAGCASLLDQQLELASSVTPDEASIDIFESWYEECQDFFTAALRECQDFFTTALQDYLS